MGEFLRFFLAAVLTLGGLAVLISGVFGVFRFRYALNRIHAAALNDTVGIALTLLGVIVAEGLSPIGIRLALVAVFLWATSPVASHLLGRLEITANDELSENMNVTDEKAVLREKEGK